MQLQVLDIDVDGILETRSFESDPFEDQPQVCVGLGLTNNESITTTRQLSSQFALDASMTTNSVVLSL